MPAQPSAELESLLSRSPRGAWLAGLLPLLACCGLHVLVAGAVLAGWLILSAAGLVVAALAGAAFLLWRRNRRDRRCPR